MILPNYIPSIIYLHSISIITMTRFRLTCTSHYMPDLRNYVRRIEEAKIPDLTLEYEDWLDDDWGLPDVYVDIGTLDALLKLRDTFGFNVILLDDNILEIYNDWRE